MWFGALLLAVVLGVLGLNTDEILARRLVDWDFHRWLGAYLAAFVGLTGLAILVHGVGDVRRVARVGRGRAASPAEPWRWDYTWDGLHSVDDDTARRARLFIGIGIGLLVLLAPWEWLAVVTIIGQGPLFEVATASVLGLGALLFSIIGVGLVIGGAVLVWRRLRYGQGVATFARFPFRLGQQLELHVEAPHSLPQHAIVTATLRCVQERYVTKRVRTEGNSTDERTNVQCFELYRDTAPAQRVDSAFGSALRVAFKLPADGPTTDLASRPCRYWEVEVAAATDGVDYNARFLVPVY